MTLCQYFGWRALTACSLLLKDVEAKPTERGLKFGTCFFKGRTDVYPVGLLQLDKIPRLARLIATHVVKRRREGAIHVFEVHGSAAKFVQDNLEQFIT